VSGECGRHAGFLGAVADGERVPPGTRRHITGCLRCAGDVTTYRLLSEQLRAAAALEQHPGARKLTHWRRVVIAAVAALVLAAQLHVARVEEHLLVAAINAGSSAPEFDSSDLRTIERWCQETASRPLPNVALPELTPIGARMDREEGALILTVLYVTPDGRRLAISWLDGQPVRSQQQGAETRQIQGRTALLVRSPAGKAVVSGDASLARLWTSASVLAASGP
jgi:hypothetical protein